MGSNPIRARWHWELTRKPFLAYFQRKGGHDSCPGLDHWPGLREPYLRGAPVPTTSPMLVGMSTPSGGDGAGSNPAGDTRLVLVASGVELQTKCHRRKDPGVRPGTQRDYQR